MKAEREQPEEVALTITATPDDWAHLRGILFFAQSASVSLSRRHREVGSALMSELDRVMPEIE